MRSIPFVAAVGAFVALLGPLTASTGATVGGPLTRAGLATLDAELAKSPPPTSEKLRTDWEPVTRLRPGGEIIVTLRGLRPMTHRLLSADAEQLMVLDANDPRLPNEVRKTLLESAKDRPLTLLAARTRELQLPGGVRATPAGIFLGEQRVADSAEVIRSVLRTQVTDIRVRRKHIGTHSRRGFLIGAAVGAGLGAVIGASCESGCEVLPMTGVGALFGGVWGLEFGTVVGILAPRSPDVIYHVD